MSDNNNYAKSEGSGIVGIAILSFLIGFWFYGSIECALYVTLFGIGCSSFAILGVIPIIGTFFAFLGMNWLKGLILTKVAMTMGITIIFWYSMGISLLLTIIILIAFLIAV